MEIVNFVCFTNGFWTERFFDIPACNARSSSVLLTVFWTNSSCVSMFSEYELFRRFPVGFSTNAVIFFEFPNEGDFVSCTKVFGRNGVAADSLSDDENSSMFLQDFDEMGFGHRFLMFLRFVCFPNGFATK